MRTEDGKPRPIEWTSTVDGTMIGTGSHLHPGGYKVLTENFGSEENPCRDDGRGTGGTLLLNSDVINRKAPMSEDYQTEVTRPSWRAPVHKGDRIRITGYYRNKKHAWYTAMTHNGLLHRRGAAAEGPLQAVPRRQGQEEADPQEGEDPRRRARESSSAASTRPRACRTASGATTHDTFCGVKFGFDPCEPPFDAPEPGPAASRVLIANFQYLPGGRGAPGNQGMPPTVKQGESLQFVNVDQQANIRHSVTTCKYPCNGRYVSNYPRADGSGTRARSATTRSTAARPNPLAVDAARPEGRQVLVLLPHPSLHARRVPRSPVARSLACDR